MNSDPVDSLSNFGPVIYLLPASVFLSLGGGNNTFLWSVSFIVVKYAQHKTSPFQIALNSVAFSALARMGNNHYCLVSEHFHHPPKDTLYIKSSFPFCSPSSPWQRLIFFVSLWTCSFWLFHMNGSIQYITLHVWLFQLGLFGKKNYGWKKINLEKSAQITSLQLDEFPHRLSSGNHYPDQPTHCGVPEASHRPSSCHRVIAGIHFACVWTLQNGIITVLFHVRPLSLSIGKVPLRCRMSL